MSKADDPFRYFHSSPEIIRLMVQMCLSIGWQLVSDWRAKGNYRGDVMR